MSTPLVSIQPETKSGGCPFPSSPTTSFDYRLLLSFTEIGLVIIFVFLRHKNTRANRLVEGTPRKMSTTISASEGKNTQDGKQASASIIGIGAAFPPLYSQDEVRDAICLNYKFTSDTLDFMHRVFRATQFDSCAIAADRIEMGKRMSRTEYVAYVKKNLKKLSLEAIEEAMSCWGGDKKDITHIVFGTMTQSIHAPTMDVELALELGLPMTAKRLNVEGMGCLTGFRCMALGATICESDPTARVLVVCADIRSALMNQMPEYPTRKHLITAALFRDSAGAVIMGDTKNAKMGTERPIFTVRKHESFLIPDSFDIVSLAENDSADILLNLSKDLPNVVCRHVRPLVERLTEGYDVDLNETEIALHTGGPRIVKYVADSLNLKEDGNLNMQSTWEVMKKYGNLSGSSNLVVLHHIFHRQEKAAKEQDSCCKTPDGKYVICMSMGPGMALEAVLLERHIEL